MRFRRRPAITALFLALSAALPLPAGAGQGIYEPIPLLPKDREILEKSGEMEALFERRGFVVAGGPAAELVARVGDAVMVGFPAEDYQRYRFRVLRSEVPNAFAMPDGQIYVHEGLLALLENEAQLASVLAHEVMHVAGHHSILHARQARKKAGGMIALSVVLGPVGDLINIAFVHAIIGYGRDLEEEADKRALDRVLAAGYEVREMPKIFELMDIDPEGDQPPVKAAWSDHPLNQQRLAYSTEILAGMEPRIAEEAARRGGLVVGRESYVAAVHETSKDVVDDLIDADRPRTALVLAGRLAVRHPEDPDVQVLLGEGWRALDARVAELPDEQLTPKAKKQRVRSYRRYTPQERERLRVQDPAGSAVLEANWAESEAAYLRALAMQPMHPDALAGLGALHEEQGEWREAGHYYSQYLESAPPDLGRPLIVRRLAEVTAKLRQAQGGVQ